MHGIALSDARVGTAGVVASVDLPDEVSHHLAHLGFLPGAAVEVLRRAPAGDPRVYRIDGVEVGLRNETAQHIYLQVNAAGALQVDGEAEASKNEGEAEVELTGAAR
jgi:Fe2+ transport system protein FeoA